jgi:hypothetical protein
LAVGGAVDVPPPIQQAFAEAVGAVEDTNLPEVAGHRLQVETVEAGAVGS